MSHPITVLCVDDHTVVLEGLALLIGMHQTMKMIASATTGKEAISLFRKHRPDVTLVDLELPDMSGVQVIETIRREYPQARMIVLSMYAGEEDIYRAVRAGACAYLLKDVHSHELVETIRAVHAGESKIPAMIAERLAMRESNPSLTSREQEVMELLAQGLRNKEIATVLRISAETAHVHLRNIYNKLGVSDKTAALRVAVRRGIVRLSSKK